MEIIPGTLVVAEWYNSEEIKLRAFFYAKSVKDGAVVPERDSSYPPMYRLRTRWALEDCEPVGGYIKVI